jgi:hypothetical protein
VRIALACGKPGSFKTRGSPLCVGGGGGDGNGNLAVMVPYAAVTLTAHVLNGVICRCVAQSKGLIGWWNGVPPSTEPFCCATHPHLPPFWQKGSLRYESKLAATVVQVILPTPPMPSLLLVFAGRPGGMRCPSGPIDTLLHDATVTWSRPNLDTPAMGRCT